jgi:hypothetical protein
MNLVGKIFIVLIVVLSLVFMAISMAVYASQRNWRDEVVRDRDKTGPGKELGLQWQLKDALTANQALKDEKAKLEKDYSAEKVALQQQLTKAQSDYELAKKDRISLQAGRAELEKQTRDSVAAMQATQKNAADYRQERDKLRTLLAQAQLDRDKHFGEVVRLTNDLNEAVNDKEQLRKREGDLAKDLAKADEALRWYGFDKNTNYKSKDPPKLSAQVTSVHGDNLIEISLGSDAGLRKGHQLHVYRINGNQRVYVGQVEVVGIPSPTASVCKANPKNLNSNVMVNDRVTSTIE